MTGDNMLGGSLRLLFAFSAGLLLSRIFKPVKVKGAFWIGGVAIVILSAIPRVGGSEHLWMNGLYDTLCAVVVFPVLVYIGASGKISGRFTNGLCKFLGDISLLFAFSAGLLLSRIFKPVKVKGAFWIGGYCNGMGCVGC